MVLKLERQTYAYGNSRVEASALRSRCDAAERAVSQMVEAWESVDGCPRETMLAIAKEYRALLDAGKGEKG